MLMPCLWQKSCAALLLFGLAMFVSGCATPVGVRRVTPRAAYEEAQANPLGDAVLSDATKVVLDRSDLRREFKSDPAQAIADLHGKALTDGRRDMRYALSETCYLYGEQLRRSFFPGEKKSAADYFLLSAVYAYLYLLADMAEPPPVAYDQRFRMACELYNFSLWRAMSQGNVGSIEFPEGRRQLPVGSLTIALDRSHLTGELQDLDQLQASYAYTVRGITIRNRTAGLGLPLIGLNKKVHDAVFAEQSVPLTAFLRLHGGLPELTAGTATASIELYSAYNDAGVSVNNNQVPLETDTTTPTAYTLENESLVWDYGLKAFLGDLSAIPNRLCSLQPYESGRIPVVFVHGTMSSPVWWTEMWNTLRADPELRRRYQFWFFVYNSGGPSTLSAADLRDSLKAQLSAIDPEGRDAALKNMVVIGHSQGGLLAKLCAVETGDRLLRALTDKDLDTLDFPEDTKKMLQRALFVEHPPFVKRVVFISTPHRGSYRSSSWVRTIMGKLIKLPSSIVKLPFDMYQFVRTDLQYIFSDRIPTSIDSMSPKNPVLLALADMPLAPGVTGNSIIADNNPDAPPDQRTDGVVMYTSAHLEAMESEYVVRSGHSCQGHPLVIEEVRRILLEHLEGNP